MPTAKDPLTLQRAGGSRLCFRAGVDERRPGGLPRRELRVRNRVGEVGGWRVIGEADDRAVDDETAGPVGGWLPGGGIEAGQQVGTRGGQVEDHVLVDLASVEPLIDGLLG